jgi:hypothetical protein
MPHVDAIDLAERVRDPERPIISAKRVAELLHIDLQDLAAFAGVHRSTLRKSPASVRLQERMREVVRVLSAASAFTARSTDWGIEPLWT